MPKYTLAELAEKFNGTVKGDPNHSVSGLASLQTATENDLSFLANAQYKKYLLDTKAGAVLLKAEQADMFVGNAIILDDPYLTYAKISYLFDTKPISQAGIHPTAVIADSVKIDPTASIGAHAVIEADVVIGARTVISAHCFIGARCVIGEDGWLAPRATLYHDVKIGKRVVIQSGAVIGGEGFGFAIEKGNWFRIAQIGGVTLGDDVEIGANTTVDRGALADTIIGNDVKLDNQIMIGHNVQIGDHTAMAACVGISGSTKIGKRCIIGGSVGMAGHLEICDNVILTGMTMVTRSISEPGTYSSGTSMQTSAEWRKSVARFRHLDEMARKIQQLEKRLAEVEQNDKSSS
ncbi:UDP-3-O-(3-hydroxymyristoyl)glucosamine N-acyltransferase [Entomomonas asaccharolytica]|uniref:UDP-3-O-acylglucosamine N-acyltransferase n=1 Tax=Entomomonas asaccharolytica TaxID=2785331 RepID=A0A974RWW7_9GAMM|nr:UDP-3-O-(3-hydroxymyristoyl)glucosamine N-acyltransferase [Entomomonas asaccharolytica]QQP85595.1 UDP-3-O-(3-hydroxymyristoyl)glucosamine N-acyltransferase [Entomomonas asaccharolytica]